MICYILCGDDLYIISKYLAKIINISYWITKPFLIRKKTLFFLYILEYISNAWVYYHHDAPFSLTYPVSFSPPHNQGNYISSLVILTVSFWAFMYIYEHVKYSLVIWRLMHNCIYDTLYCNFLNSLIPLRSFYTSAFK